MRSRLIFLVGVLTVVGLLGGVTASSVSAVIKTTVTWKVSSMTAGQVKSLSAVAKTNSPGGKTWSKKGSCVLSPKSTPPKLTMGLTGSCTLTLKIAKTSKYPAKTSSKTIILALYGVGDTGPAGGTIFYVDLTRPEGSQYFEAACAGWSDGGCGGSDLEDPSVKWLACYLTPLAGADGTTIGTGEQNTNNIVAACPETGVAAKVADDVVLGGQTDWFLPSKDELNALCKWALNDTVNAVCNGYYFDFPTNGFYSYYWSSSKSDVEKAWHQDFRYGDQGTLSKGVTTYIRPIRSF